MKTPLLLAAEKGFFDITKLLLKKNAQMESSDVDDQTALILAAQNGHAEVVKYLLKRGAKENAKSIVRSSLP